MPRSPTSSLSGVTTSVSSTSAPTTWAGWATGRRTLTASPRKARSSRTGMASKAAPPGAPEGLQPQDPTIADLLKPLGYATGQFGKNHLGDRNEFLPTVHGFDEFFGNLYHLNAEEEPELPDYP